MRHRLFTGERGHFYRMALSLALPIALQNLLTSCATLIDTAMVVGLGDNATAAMGVANRFSFLLNVVCFGFASGCASLLSQYWGAKDRNNIRRCLGLVLSVAFGFGVIYAAVLAIAPSAMMRIFTDDAVPIGLGAGYLRVYAIGVPFVVFSQIMCIALRSVERVRIPLISAAASVVLNTFLNYCLIGGHLGFPALGLRGAAIGSVAGYVLQSAVILLFVIFADTPFRGRLRDFFSFSRAFCIKYFKTAFPVLFNEGAWAIGTNIYVMVFARQGVENYAGYTLFENIQQIFFVFFVGICGACSVMVGMKVGAGEHKEAYVTARRFAVMTPLVGLVLGTLLVLLRNPILSLFPIETEQARSVASVCLLFYGFWIGARMIQYTLICGVFRAGGDTKTGCIFDMVGVYLFGIPAVLITAYLVRPYHFVVLVIVMMLGEDVIKGVLCVWHFITRRWIKQITEPKKGEM